MSEWTSLSCKTETKERVKTLQREDEGQDDVINRALDALEVQDDVEEVSPASEYVGTDTGKKNIRLPEDRRIDELLELVKDMDVVSNNQRVLTRIDDLETELKTHLERELRQ